MSSLDDLVAAARADPQLIAYITNTLTVNVASGKLDPDHDGLTNAEELLDMCRRVDSQVSRATVYRTLGVLDAAGFIEGLETGDGGKKFEHVLGHRHHDHMICNDCGRIIEFHDDALEARKESIVADRGYKLISHSLKLMFECGDAECRYRRALERPPAGS